MQKVYVIEDEVLLRDLLIELLKSRRDLEIAGYSGDGMEGYNQCREIKPRFVVLDLRLPTLNGVEVARRLRRDFPALKMLILSGALSLGTIKRVMAAKPNGILEKGAGLAEMEKAIRCVASGQSYFGPAIVKQMPELIYSEYQERSLDALTGREREVLQLVAEGYTTKEIASRLFISPRTADVHRMRLMRKLGVRNAAGLTRLAVSFGLVPVPAVV